MILWPPRGIEAQAVAQMTRHARDAHLKRELLICTDSTTPRKIGSSLGSGKDARLTGVMLRHLRGGGRCRLWHNHPSYGSLSITDWRLALHWAGIDEIGAVNQSGTWFRGDVQNKDKLLHITKTFIHSHMVGRLGAIATTHFQDAEVIASNALMSTPSPKFNLYLAAFGTHAVNAALSRLAITGYSMTLGGNDAMMHSQPMVKTAIAQSINAAHQHLLTVL